MGGAGGGGVWAPGPEAEESPAASLPRMKKGPGAAAPVRRVSQPAHP